MLSNATRDLIVLLMTRELTGLVSPTERVDMAKAILEVEEMFVRSTSLGLTTEQKALVQRLTRQGDRIEAIKLIRRALNVDLWTAKTLQEAIAALPEYAYP